MTTHNTAQPFAKLLPPVTGWWWCKRAWQQFVANWQTWLGINAAFIIFIVIASLVPMLSSILMPVFMAGMVYAAAQQQPKFSHLFIGFEKNVNQLFICGLLTAAITVLIMFIALLVSAVFIITLLASIDLQQQKLVYIILDNAQLIIYLLLLFLLVCAALLLPLLMALWFAPALIVLDNMTAVAALRLSFAACAANILPFTVVSVLFLALIIAASLSLFLALAVIIPLWHLMMYQSYLGVFKGA